MVDPPAYVGSVAAAVEDVGGGAVVGFTSVSPSPTWAIMAVKLNFGIYTKISKNNISKGRKM